MNAPRIEISATMIRESIREGKSVKYLLLPAVEKHIDEMLVSSSKFSMHGESREMSVLFADQVERLVYAR